MTVRVNKDAFNIREKLSELDYRDIKPTVFAYARKSSGDTLATSAIALSFPTTIIDTHSGFSNDGRRYTVPVAGNYMVMFNINALSNSNVTTVRIEKNGVAESNLYVGNTNHPRMMFNLTAIVPANTGDYFEIKGYVNTGSLALDNAGNVQYYLL